MDGRWAVAQTKGGREALAAEGVVRQGLEYYLPKIRPQMKGKKLGKEQCLFPGYLFVLIEKQWRFLESTDGIHSLIMIGSMPGFLTSDEIENIKAREDSEGYIKLAEATEDENRIKRGDKVRVLYGPLSGLDGICERTGPHERIKVLFNLMGRRTRVQLARHQVERQSSIGHNVR